MKRKNISEALNRLDDRHISETEVFAPELMHSAPERIKSMKRYTTKRTAKRFVTIAIAACLVLSLGIAAYAVATRVIMSREAVNENSSLGTDQVTYSFEPVADEFIDCKHWMPSMLPEEYRIDFISEYFEFNGSQNVRYKNKSGETIQFIYGKPGSGMSLGFDDVLSEEEFEIGGKAGVLTKAAEYNSLLWTDDATGYAFVLTCSDTELDIAAIAESVVGIGQPMTATNVNDTENAIESLGDYKPAYLPDGYEENGYYGRANDYIRRYYVNKASNRNINFSYELYVLEDGVDNKAENVLALYSDGESVTVNGLPGAVKADKFGASVHWVDTEKSMVFTLFSDGVQPDELLKVAESIK